jgi:hypothetical protein
MPRPIKPTGRPRARPDGIVRVTVELSAEHESAAYYYLTASTAPYRDTIARALECLATSENHPAITADGQAQIELSLAYRPEALKPGRRSVQPDQTQKAPLKASLPTRSSAVVSLPTASSTQGASTKAKAALINSIELNVPASDSVPAAASSAPAPAPIAVDWWSETTAETPAASQPIPTALTAVGKFDHPMLKRLVADID